MVKETNSEITGRLKNCFLFYGNDSVLIQSECRKKIHSYFSGQEPQPVVFNGTEDYGEYIQAIRGQSLFTSDTAIIINNPSFLIKAVKDEKSFDGLLEAMRKMPDSTLVLMTLSGKPDRRLKAAKQISALLADGKGQECNLLRPQKAPEELISMFTMRHKRVPFDVRRLITDTVSAWSEVSLPMLQSIVDKACLLAGDKQEITMEVMQDALPGDMGQQIFRFCDELIAGNAEYILENTRHIFTDVSREVMSLGFLSSRFRQIKMFKELKKNRITGKERLSLMGLHSPWQLNQIEKEADRISEGAVDWFLNELFVFQYRNRVESESLNVLDLFLRFCARQKRYKERVALSRHRFHSIR